MKIIYYYQTFVGLDKILNDPKTVVTHIHLSSIHFGLDDNAKPYIHLNDNDPDDPKFNDLWDELREAKNKGIKIVLMVGGAGGAYGTLFGKKYTIYRNLLFDTILKHRDIISGIDLDIEEYVTLPDVKMLISDIVAEFGSKFIISMAPVQDSVMNDDPGMGGFIYKDLIKSAEGQFINYLNVQCYGDFSMKTYETILNNDYQPEMINMGMLSSQDFPTILETVKEIRKKYKLAGVYNWEYYSSPPNSPTDPSEWAKFMAMTIESSCSYIRALINYSITPIMYLFPYKDKKKNILNLTKIDL